MCEICLRSPCLNGCPNQPEPKCVHHCPLCEEGILEGERTVEIDSEYYHLDCLSDLSTEELIYKLGYEVETEGSPEDYGYDED